MKERPIPFSAPMVRAILSGTKTQTRRALRDGTWWTKSHGVIRMAPAGLACTGFAEVPCPYGAPGDRLWVREAWRTTSAWDSTPPRDLPGRVDLHYEASGRPNAHFCFGKLRPGMFMPRAASRITLEVTGVRVERLQDISEADAMAEGITGEELFRAQGYAPLAYRRLWDSINGAGSWDANPWVWCISFRRLQ